MMSAGHLTQQPQAAGRWTLLVTLLHNTQPAHLRCVSAAAHSTRPSVVLRCLLHSCQSSLRRDPAPAGHLQDHMEPDVCAYQPQSAG